MSDKERVLEKLRKLHKLASESPHDGERQAAEARLFAIMDRYKLDWNLLDEPDTQRFWFTYRSKRHKQIIMNAAHRILDSSKITYHQARGRSEIGFDLTEQQGSDLRALADRMWKQWKIEEERLFAAFCSKHQLRPKDSVRYVDVDDVTPEEWADIERRAALARSLEDLPDPSAPQLETG